MQPSKSVVRKLRLGLGILSLAAAVGCGYGGSGVVLPHPSGNYSNASLNGKYVYQIRGTSQFGAYREFGVVTADGAGHVTAGIDDFVSTGTGLISSNPTGTYTVANDGTGFITLSPTALGTINLAITLVSPSKFDLIEADSNTNAAGTAEFQDSTAAGITPSGTFVYRLHQVPTSTQGAVSEVGAITVSAGSVTGNLDQNSGGTSSQLTLTGTFTGPATLGSGGGSFTDSTNFTTNFFYYIINSGKILFLATNSGTVESGSAELRSGAVSGGLSGNYVFGSRGDVGLVADAVATAGQFSATGTGTISSYVDDSMRLGVYSTNSLTGTYTASSNGRVAVTLNQGAVQQVLWMVTPARVFFLTNDPNKVEDGTADLQTTPSFSTSTVKGQFALVMDGIDFLAQTPEFLSRIGTLQFDGAGKLVLTEEVNASNSGSGAVSPGVLTGTYQVSSNGFVVATLNGSTLNLVIYAASGSNAYALQVDSATNTSGTIELQH